MNADRWDEFTLQELDLLRHVGDYAQGYYSARQADELVAQIDQAIERRRARGKLKPEDIERET